MRALALSFLLCALVPSAVQAAGGAPEVTVANAPWRLVFAAEGAQPRGHEYKPGGDAARFLYTRRDGISVNVFIAPAGDCKSAEACRDRLWKSLQPKLDGTEQVSQSTLGAASTIEIFVKKLRNLPVHEKTLYAVFLADGHWVDFRVVKGGYKPGDQAAMEALVQSVRFERKP